MNKDWIFEADNFICHVRTVGVLIRENKMLVQRDNDGNEYALPGGHIKIGETAEESLIREFREETGADIICQRLLWTEECFWEWNGKKAHNISFYYLVDLCENSDIPDNCEFVPQKDNCDVLLGWLPIEKIGGVTIYPNFIKEEIGRFNETPKHFVRR